MGIPAALTFLKDATISGIQAEDKGKLLEAYNAALDEMTRRQTAEARVRELEEALRFKERVHFERNALWAEGDPHPFCNACWENSLNAVHLIESHHDPHHYACPVCKVEVDTDARDKQIHAARMRAQSDALSEARQRRHREQYGDD